MRQTRSLFSWCLIPSGGNRLNQQINKSLLDNDKCYDGNSLGDSIGVLSGGEERLSIRFKRNQKGNRKGGGDKVKPN